MKGIRISPYQSAVNAFRLYYIVPCGGERDESCVSFVHALNLGRRTVISENDRSLHVETSLPSPAAVIPSLSVSLHAKKSSMDKRIDSLELFLLGDYVGIVKG